MQPILVNKNAINTCCRYQCNQYLYIFIIMWCNKKIEFLSLQLFGSFTEKNVATLNASFYNSIFLYKLNTKLTVMK